MKNIIPAAPDLLREALIVLGGAIIAAFIISRIPPLKAFIQQNINGCDCDR